MPLYRKKPVEVEALQWTEYMTSREMNDFTNGLVKLDDVARKFCVYDRLHDTWVQFEYGDYIIKGIRGEFYPCKRDVFVEMYDPVVSLSDV